MKVKKNMKKIIASILVIAFFVSPIMQIKYNIGEVSAYQPGDSIDGFTHEELRQKAGPNNHYAIDNTQTENKYRVRYFRAFEIANVKECHLHHFDKGKPLNTNIPGSSVRIISSGNSYQDRVQHRASTYDVHTENVYSVRIGVEGWYETSFMKNENFPDIHVVTQLGSYGRDLQVDMPLSITDKNIIQTKYHARVIANSSNNNGNSGGSSNSNNGGNGGGYIENSPAAQQIIYESNDNGYTPSSSWEPEYYEKRPPAVYEKNIYKSDEDKRLYIKALYKLVLGREASEDEINAHIGNSIQRIAVNIILSPESDEKNHINSLSNEDFVRKLYNFLLQRDPDGPGLASHTENMDSGLDKEKSIIDIAQSEESQKLISNLEREINIEDDSKIIYYDTLYRSVLGRGPNQDDIDYNLKNTVQHNTFDVIFSPESVEKHNVYHSSNKDFVTFLYKVILGREPDQPGLNANIGFLNVGNPRTLLSQKFVESQEFAEKRLRECKSINLDENLRNAVYSNLISQGFEVGKTGSNTIIMYKDDFERVTKLDLSGKELKNIDGLSLFTNLEKLIIQNNKLENIDELIRMHNLKYLNVNGCGLKNKVATINSLTNLEELHIENNELTVFGLNKAISNCTKLQKLYVSNNSLINISAALSLPNIKEVYADNNKISAIKDSYSNLDKLSLKNQKISITGFGEEKNLPDIVRLAQDNGSSIFAQNGLAIENCRVKDGKIMMSAKTGKIRIIDGIAGGTEVNLQDSKLVITLKDKVLADRIQKELDTFCKERNDSNGQYILYVDKNYVDTIMNLDLSAQKDDSGEIKDITGIENFENLKTLNLNNNKVTNLNQLSKLKNLETLSVRFNGLTSLESLKDLTNLAQLDASNNSITDTKEIASLTKLNTLLLSNNNIGNNLNGIKSLSNLKTLAIANNNVSNLDALSSLNIESLYASLNKITNVSKITENGYLKNLDLKNNNVDIEINGDNGDIPQIIEYVIDKYDQNTLECINCSINNNKINIDSGARFAQIKVKTGNASDTVVNLRNKADVKPPRVNEIKYELSNDKTRMRVTIIADKEIQNIIGWDRGSGRNTIYKDFNYNVSNMNVVIRDFFGNETNETISFSSVVNSKIPGLTVKYSNVMPTNQDVDVTISTTDSFRTITSPGWTRSADKKSMTKKYTENTDSSYTVPEVVTEYMFEHQIPPEKVDVQVLNIDKQNPVCTVQYSETQKTKSSIRATIWSDENIELVNKDNKMYSYVVSQDDNGNNKYGISLYYPENTEETIVVKDIAGNISNVSVKVNNIDRFVDGLDVKIRGIVATSGNETVNIKADEAISLNNNTITAKVKQVYRTALEPMFTVAGSLNTTPIMTGDLNVICDSPIMYLSDTNLGLITRFAENDVTSSENGNELSMEVSSGVQGTVAALDNSNNTDVAPYNTNNIDKNAPAITREDTANEDGSITVKLIINEEIKETEDLAGWTLSDDKKSMTKTFKFNGVENIVVQDLAGNETEYSVEINSINTIKYVVYFEKIENSSKYLVIIKADRDLAEVDGWRHLENKNEIAKVLSVGEKESLIINGINDGSAMVYIEVFGDGNYGVEGNNQENPENNNNESQQNDKDTTQSDKSLPQTGKFAVIAIALVFAVIIVVNRKRKYNKFNIK